MNQPFVQTVTGIIPPQALGDTLMHEHLFIDGGPWTGRGALASTVPVPAVLEKLRDAHSVGVRTLVDASPRGIRPLPLLQAYVGVQTELNVVVATGWYCHDQTPPPRWMHPMAGGTAEKVRDAILDDAKDGIDKSGVKPGIIKVATSFNAISKIEEMTLIGAAQAQQACGLGITTHTQESRWAEEQAAILRDNGADLDRVVIGHMGWGAGPSEIDRVIALASTGVTVGLDMVGLLPVRADAEWVEMAFRIVEAGFGDRLVLSHDHSASFRGTAGWESADPGWFVCEFSKIHAHILPELRERGVEEETINQIIRRTPERILAIDPIRYPGAVETLLAPATLH